jgi:hypothetical protein
VKRDDPGRVKASFDREHARTMLGILCKGIGHALAEEPYRCGDAAEIHNLIGHVNTELLQAVRAYERAEKAYEPYWRRRRIRVAPRKKKAAA